MKHHYRAAAIAAATVTLGLASTAEAFTFSGISDRKNTSKLTNSLTIGAAYDLTNPGELIPNSPIVTIGGVDYQVVDAIATDDTDRLYEDLMGMGLLSPSKYGRVVSGLLPLSPDMADEMDKLASLKFYRIPQFSTQVGAVTSQADATMRADIARATFGIDGNGTTLGVLSDSFDHLGGAVSDIATGDLPGTGNPLGNNTPVNVLLDLPNGGSDEGRAMSQLVHDVAPGADLAFHTAFLGTASFANGILDLASVAGANVIVDDVGILTEPMFQDGVIAQAANTVVENGVAYFSSAGNSDRDAYESEARIVDTPFGALHDFDPGPSVDVFQSIFVPFGTGFTASFQWDSPFFSAGGSAGSPNDLDIFLLDEGTTTVVAGSIDNNVGQDAVELFSFFNDGSTGSEVFNIAVSQFSGPDAGFLKYILFGFQGEIIEFDTNSGTLFGHPNAVGAEAVGAAFYQDTPEFGVNPPELEPFSSAGPTPIFFDADGNRLAVPEIRRKPDITAPDGTDTTFFGFDVDSNGFPNFFGTSAAAPHAAAVAALMLEANPSLSPEEIYSILEQTAIDMDDPFTPGFDIGPDFASGFGLIQADAAVASAIAPEQVPEPGSILAMLATAGAALQLRRRRVVT